MAGAERADLVGAVLDGRWRLGEPLGTGGTGVVFEATDLDDGAAVVVKTMRPAFAHDPDLCRRLRREAEVARTVGHPGIVPVLAEGTLADGSPYVVMQRIVGESLGRLLLRHGPLEEPVAALLGMRIASILHAVHARGYVHRDLKPEHVLVGIGPQGLLEVYLIDFGVCAAPTAPADERHRERGRVYGTPTYVSPEQAMGDPDVDGRADVFGLGVVMFEALTGRVPFTAPNVASLLRRIIREDAPRLGLVAPWISREMDEIVSRCLARVREQRMPSMRAVARAMAPLVSDRLEAAARLGRRLGARAVPYDAMPTPLAEAAA
ncbi:MAG: serine/threonine protein kinase [Myxococcota bacterium]|nr:serine/threonine protein kinase [Myxococcota bacterium]MDW8362464.1 serine/threonine-protein kinase [Myxococcales bacterium]